MNYSNKQNYDLENRLIDFAVAIISISELMPKSKSGNHISGQILRSGTSPAPNYGEAQAAESKNDFIHKMKIALKELRETIVWLKIISRSDLVEPGKLESVLKENDELIAIFVSSLRTAAKS